MGSKPCPTCGTLNSVTANVCHKCGSLMRDVQRPPSGGGGAVATVQVPSAARQPTRGAAPSETPSGSQAAPTERWSGRRWRSGAKSPGPRADVPARTDQRARADRPEARHQEADRRQRRREFGRPERRRELVRRSLSRPSPNPFSFSHSQAEPSAARVETVPADGEQPDDATASSRAGPFCSHPQGRASELTRGHTETPPHDVDCCRYASGCERPGFVRRCPAG